MHSGLKRIFYLFTYLVNCFYSKFKPIIPFTTWNKRYIFTLGCKWSLTFCVSDLFPVLFLCPLEIKLVSFISSGTWTCSLLSYFYLFLLWVVSSLLKNQWGKNAKKNLSQVSFCERVSVTCKATSGACVRSQAYLLTPASATCPLWKSEHPGISHSPSPWRCLIVVWTQVESWMETLVAYHLPKKSGNFGLKSNGKVIFRKFRSEIVEYLQRYSSFSVRNRTAEISLPFAELSSFQSLISWKQLREIKVQMVSAISFGWFADFGKTLTIIQRSSQPVYSDKW